MKNQNYFKLWLLLCSTLTVMAGATLAPALPAMAESAPNLHNIDFIIKLIVALPGIVIAITGVALGRYIDKYPKFKILNICLLGYGIFGTIGFFNQNLMVLLISRAILGVWVAGIMVSVTVIAAEIYKGEQLGQYMGLQAAFGSFGAVIFLAASGILAGVNWTYPFFSTRFCSSFIRLGPIF